jgi:hypothetical protein
MLHGVRLRKKKKKKKEREREEKKEKGFNFVSNSSEIITQGTSEAFTQKAKGMK